MNTSIWGPSAWRLIHSVAFTYPMRPSLVDKQRYKVFFESLAYTLPCVICQYNYRKELLQFDLDEALRSREHLSKWSVDLHNSVNKRLGKKVMSYDEVYEIYDELIKKVDEEKKKDKEKQKLKENLENKKNSFVQYVKTNKNKLVLLVGLFGAGCVAYRYRKK